MSEQGWLFDFPEGERRANDGMESAFGAPRIRLWREAADKWLFSQPKGREFTADDLTLAIGLPDEGPNQNNVVGAWFRAQSSARRIFFTGRMHKSGRVNRHVGVHRVWRIKS